MGLFTRWVESLYEPNKITDKCVRHISPKSTCTICIDICPHQAIQLDKTKKPVIKEDSCDECQLCVTSCPTLAIEGNLPKREYLEDTLVVNESEPIFNDRELLFLYKKGIRKVLKKSEASLDRPKDISENVKRVNELLSTIGQEKIQYTKKLPEAKKEEVHLSRRDLFGYFREKSQQTILTSYTPASWRNNHHLLDTNKLYPDIGFYQVHIDEDTCTLCNICESLCPENCFEKISEGEQAAFLIRQDKCIGCDLCVDICPESSITVEPKVSTKDNEKRYQIFENTCETCGDKFHTWNDDSENKCSICVKINSKFKF